MKIRTIASLALILLALARPTPSLAQLTSAHYKLTFATGNGAVSTSATVRAYSGMPGPMIQRSTSDSYDVFTGFVGYATNPLDSILYNSPAKTYQMLGFPMKYANASPGNVLAGLGPYDTHVWRLGHFDPATGAYKEADGGINAILDGRGYWLITANNSTFRTVGLPPREDVLLFGDAQFTLIGGPSNAPAWNQMANPYPFPIGVDSILVTDNSTYVGIIRNPSNAITSQTVKVWNPSTSQYVDASVINGRQGFWIKKLTTLPVRMAFLNRSSKAGTTSPNMLALMRQMEAAPVRSGPSAQWTVSLTAREDGRTSQPMVIGAADVPAGQWNTLCDAMPPAPPDLELLTLHQSRQDWGRLSGDYTRVIQRGADVMTWDFVASGARSPGELALDVSAQGLPSGTRLWLTDVATGTRQELTADEPLSLPAYAGDRSYRIEAIGGTAQQPVATVIPNGLVHAYPNPFRSGSGLAFGLAKSGDVAVDVFDLQGRLVRSLSRSGLAAGEHVLVWDGRDASGRAVGSGVFLARWRAGELRGTTRLVKVD